MPPPLPPAAPTLTAPSFHLIGRQPLRPAVLLLALAVAAGTLAFVIYALGRPGHTHIFSNSSEGNSADDDKDDPNQIDTIVLGDPSDAPVPGRKGNHVSNVHPTIVIRLPRSGSQTGQIPSTPAGQLLYNWLAAFNKPDYPALSEALPNVAPAFSLAAQRQLRQQTGGFNLLSAKEVQPGVLVFRLLDQSPSSVEVLGTLQMDPDAFLPTVRSFSLRAVPPSAPPAESTTPTPSR